MKLRSVGVEYGRTFNLGDYNNLRITISLQADLEDGDDPELAVKGLRQMARRHAQDEAARNPKLAAAVKTKDLFMGLPLAVQKEIKEHADTRTD